MTLKNPQIVILSIFIGIIFAILCNYILIERIIIPDPCYYHSHDTNKVFDIFYALPPSEGFHPFPTMFNFIFTLIIGAVIGFIFSIIVVNRHKKNKHNT